ncbi:MAG: capsular biosynthesis protein [Ottowia sp.]|nr:capsular biosynthesis protein [Ottowia sp.]
MINGGLSAFSGKRILLLQGPLGPFFRRLGRDLVEAGAHVIKIDFNGGDWLFSPSNSIAFRDSLVEWPVFFEKIIIEHKIDRVFLFGDCRPLHLIAHEIAGQHNIDVSVFEEGYLRPDYVTLEQFGVNGNSQISRSPDFYTDRQSPTALVAKEVGNTFWYAAGWAVLYYIASVLLSPYYRHYRHHRPLALSEGWVWIKSAWRKFKYQLKERGQQFALSTSLRKQFFLVPLQVQNDAQMHAHSDFESVENFIAWTISSFSQYAPADTLLVIKHHPMDRGYHDYTQAITKLTQDHGIEDRVRYIHDQNLPTLLACARGVVVVNSTVGLSALHHSTPLKVCGTAIYDMKGLTYQGTLDTFWACAPNETVDTILLECFRNNLVKHTQLNGSFYKRLDCAVSHSGLIWTTAVANNVVAPTSAQTSTEQNWVQSS